MSDQYLWRAAYDADQGGYVVEDAGWIDREPVILYRFSVWDDDDVDGLLGVLTKYWLDDEGVPIGEDYAFGTYADEAAFNADVDAIKEEAQHLVDERNIDGFLAIVDMVKHRAIENGFDGEGILEHEGLFQTGPEDAYTLREYDGENRLHDRVERGEDECWRIHVAQVVDPDGSHLGWGVFALLYPELASDATDEQITAATQARRLDIDHRPDKASAHFSARGTRLFMLEGDRIDDPTYAFMDDSTVLETASMQCSIEGVLNPTWETLEGDALQAFRDGTQPVVRAAERWHPRSIDMARKFAEATGMATHEVDQLYARLLNEMGLQDEFDEDSPWHDLEDG